MATTTTDNDTNANHDDNTTDENIAVPGHNKLHMCKVCYSMFLSPIYSIRVTLNL